MNTYNQAELSTLKLADIADLYNQYASITGAKPVSKFRDKPTAVKRTLEIQAIAAPFMDVEPVAAPEPVVSLTDKEHVALMAVIANGLDGMGGEEPIHLLDDNFSWFDNGDLIKLTGMSKHQCSGLMSSLELKGLIGNSEEGINQEGPDQWFVSDEGIRVAQAIKDQPIPVITPEPEVTKPTKAPKKAKAGNSKGNSKTDMTSLLEIAKERNNKEGSIAEAVFAAVNHFSNPTVQQVVDQVVATYKKPRSNVTITQGFVVSTIRYFVKEGSLKFS